jgi:aminoglycoside/choline kinase family phosphotransferase
MVKEEEVGFCFSHNDKKGVIDFLNCLQPEIADDLAQMGKRARLLAENKYSEEIILNKFLNNI